MLPSKFFDPPSSNNDNTNRPAAPPPLGMTGVICKIGRLEVKGRGTIHYRIFRPRQVATKPPLVALHGGPLVPCNYLLPLAYVVVDRSIVVYDQLGCGQSRSVAHPSVLVKTKTKNQENSDDAENNDKKSTTAPELDVAGMVQDLSLLVEHWEFSSFHLLGHSFGGILAYEYLKHCQALGKPSKCCSVILASAPTSVGLAEAEVNRLIRECRDQGTVEYDDEDDCGNSASTLPKHVPKAFRTQHECRLDPIPFPLMDSYSQAGPNHLRGFQSLGNYEATLLDSNKNNGDNPIEQEATKPMDLPAMIMRGQHDFVTESCVQEWQNLFQNASFMTLAGCSHYGMLENEIMYGSVLSSFLQDCDATTATTN